MFHPDEAKQVLALFNFLNGDYVRYYGDIFYDGYPYGLNHLDEYLLRPLLFFLGPEPPETSSLYYYARLLRVAYGMFTIVTVYNLVNWLTRDRIAALIAMFLLAIAPLSVTVTHFATGDIGIDLFTGLCFLFLACYLSNDQKKIWLLASGFAVGAAFSAKYNGLLIGLVPGMVLTLELLHHKNIKKFIIRCIFLLAGTLAGIIIFTPNLLLDFSPATRNISANFQFIKNYRVPAEIFALPWQEKAILSLKNNSLYIISSLGYIACFISIMGLLVAGRQNFRYIFSRQKTIHPQQTLFFSIAAFPLLAIVISLAGKYNVQPFHFSYLQLPLIIIVGYLFYFLRSSKNIFLRSCNLLLLLLLTLEYGHITWKENFFWRTEDNVHYVERLPSSIYKPETFETLPSGHIRSLFVEPPNISVFRNMWLAATGPDSTLWNTIQVAPLPQVPNPVGRQWIFLNGPTFPRNDKIVFIHGDKHGKTITKYLVLPAGKNWPTLGIRCGSYATEASINFGNTIQAIQLEAHQQKILELQPKAWRVSGGEAPGQEKVYIISLKISVPHDDMWITLLATPKEQELFNLFGGGQEGNLAIPAGIPPELENDYINALNHIRYEELTQPRTVYDGWSIPIWGVSIPAGHFKLICDIDSENDDTAFTIELEDARGGVYRQQKQIFTVNKGLQRIEYDFAKTFAPYQCRFIMSSLNGTIQIKSLKLFPDYQKISTDLDNWRATKSKPEWISRFGDK